MISRRGDRRVIGAVARALPAVACTLILTPVAVASTPAAPEGARLVGPFELAGHITVARQVPGERAGQNFFRTWTFFSRCRVGACDSVGLVRSRARGSDTLRLVRRSPGSYTGAGRFFAPLRCGRRTYARGQSVPFTITVRVTAATTLSSGEVLATDVSASYVNRRRTNLTRCFAVLGHDSATYAGHQLQVPGQS